MSLLLSHRAEHERVTLRLRAHRSQGRAKAWWGARALKHGLGPLSLLLSFAPVPGQAQETIWPSKTVIVVVGFGAGGVTDVMARMASRKLSEDLQQPFIVENRVGGAGNVAATFVARSAPDGHTLFFAASPQIAATPKIQAVSYDPIADFSPVSTFGSGPLCLLSDPPFRPGRLRNCRLCKDTQPHLWLSRPRLHNASHQCVIPFANLHRRHSRPIPQRRWGVGGAPRRPDRHVFLPCGQHHAIRRELATDGSWYRRQATDETAAKRADHWRILSGYRVFRMERVPCPSKNAKDDHRQTCKACDRGGERSGYTASSSSSCSVPKDRRPAGSRAQRHRSL